MMMAVSLGLELPNPTSEMSHPYPKLHYNTNTAIQYYNAITNAFRGQGCVMGKESARICIWAISVPSPQVPFWKETVSLLFLNDISSGFKSIGLLLPCPFSNFLNQNHTFPVRPKQRRGTCEPSACPLTSRFSADSAILGLPEPHSRKASNFQGNPLLLLLLFWQKISDDVSS